MIEWEIAILTFAVGGFVLAAVAVLRVGRIEAAVEVLLERDTADRIKREEDAVAPEREPPARIRSMWGNHR